MISRDAVVLDSVMLDEARTYLRMESADADASLAAVLRGAIGHAEDYLGQMLVQRGARETVPASRQWQRLRLQPVTMLMSATGIPAEGAGFPLAPDTYRFDIDRHGEAWLQVLQPGAAGRVELACEAGIAASWAELPEALRLGVLRLAAHLHQNRDNPDDLGPPEGVVALLRPWRRMRLR